MSKRNDDEMEVDDEDKNDIFASKVAYTRYTSAAAIANKVIAEIVKLCVPGKIIAEITAAGDQLIADNLKTSIGKNKIEFGVAFPTCVSVNNCFGHFSPLNSDKTALKEGDLAKIDLGVHIDGYISQVAHTFEVTSQGAAAPAITGRKADALVAAYYASEAAHRLIKAGNKNTDVTDAIAKIAKIFNVNPAEGVLSHQLKRFVIDGNNVIINKATLDQKPDEFTFEEGQIYAVDIVMSTGEGKGKEIDSKTTVFKRAVDQTYSLKMAASRYLLNEVNKKSPTFPFTIASIQEQSKAKMGVTELATHGLIVPYPVLYEKPGEYVAQLKFVVAIMKSGTNKLTGHALPLVTSEHKIEDPEIQQLLAQSTSKKDKKKAAVEAPAQAMEQ